MKPIKSIILCLSVLCFSACAEDFEDFDNKAYLNTDNLQTSYLIQPDVTSASASLNVGIPRPATSDIEFTFKADESLVTVFNNISGMKAIVLPTEHYTLSTTKATIAKESVKSTEIDIEFNDINLLNRDLIYVLPVTIASASNIELLESARTHYYVFKGGALINWAADIEENYIPVSWKNSSMVSGMSDVTIESMLYIRQIQRDGSDSNIMSFFGVEGSFLIRLGDTFDPGQVMVVTPAGNYPDAANSRTTVPVGRWFHLAITIEGGTSLKIYLDGELKSTTAIPNRSLSLASGCYIGRSWNDNRWWPGMICETRVWTVARTQEEIANSMYSVSPTSENLAGYWKFNEGNGSTVADHTEYGTSITAASSLKWTSVSLPE